MTDGILDRVGPAGGPVRTAVGATVLVAAWLALTVLSVFAGVVLLGTVVTSLEQSGVASVVVTFVGLLSVSALAPTLARVALGVAAKRSGVVPGRSTATAGDDPRSGSCPSASANDCRPRSQCCV